MTHTEPKPLLSTRPPGRPTSDLSNDQLLSALLERRGDIDQLIADFALSPARFLAFAKDPAVVEALDLLETFQLRRARALAREHQALAAEHLARALLQPLDPLEARRAASALARLAVHMLGRPTPTPTTTPTPKAPTTSAPPAARTPAPLQSARSAATDAPSALPAPSAEARAPDARAEPRDTPGSPPEARPGSRPAA